MKNSKVVYRNLTVEPRKPNLNYLQLTKELHAYLEAELKGENRLKYALSLTEEGMNVVRGLEITECYVTDVAIPPAFGKMNEVSFNSRRSLFKQTVLMDDTLPLRERLVTSSFYHSPIEDTHSLGNEESDAIAFLLNGFEFNMKE